MKIVVNYIHKIRNKFSQEKYDLFFHIMFILRNIAGYIRGLIAVFSGKIFIEGEKTRTLILGFNTKLIVRPGCAIKLADDKNLNIDSVFNNNPIFSNGTSIGLNPYYICLDPPANTTTKIDLDNKSNLVLYQNTMILSGCYLTANHGAEIFIGVNSYISSDVIINSRKKIYIGRNVMLGQEVRIMDYDAHDIFQLNSDISIDSPLNLAKSIIIEDNVWIGARVSILKGVTIGKGAIVGANSCVTSSVPPYSIAVGNPARVIKENVKWKR